MNTRKKTPTPSLNLTRRASLLTALGAAMTLAGCGGGGGGGTASASPGAAATGSGGVAAGGAVGGSGIIGTGNNAGALNPALALASNQIAVLGDSRSANATQDANITSTNRVTAEGYIAYAMIASNFRGDFTGAYAINSDTLQNMLDRLGPTQQPHGQLLSADPGKSAGIVIFLGGVNNSTDPISVTGPLYQSILQKLADAGKTVIVCNELPSNTTGLAATEQINRRTYLDSLTLPSNNGRLIKINTFDALLQAGTTNTSKTGTFAPADTLHPGPSGNQIIGELIGAELERILAGGGYRSRSAKVPKLASESVLPYAMLAGTTGVIVSGPAGAGGSNQNGAGGAGVTGPVAAGWTFGRDDNLAALLNGSQVAGNNLTITLSKGQDSEGFATQKIQILGQAGPVGAIYNVYFANRADVTAAQLVSGAANGVALADGDRLYSAARVKVSAAAKGLLGPGLEVLAESYPSAQDSGEAILSGTVAVSSSPRDWRSTAAFDKLVLSQPRILPAGFSTTTQETKKLQQELQISIAGGVPVDFTVEVSRFGIIKNP